MQFSQDTDIRCINVSREAINAVLIGEEEFNLKVGGTLIARSATYGSPSGIERVEAGAVRREKTPETQRKKDESYTLPLGDLLKLSATLTPAEETAKEIFANDAIHYARDKETAKSEAKEFLEKSDVKNDCEKIAESQQKVRAATAKMAKLEAENPQLTANPEMIAKLRDSLRQKPAELAQLSEYVAAKNEQNTAARVSFEYASSLREKAEQFAKYHPCFAKIGGYVLKEIGHAAIAGAMITAATAGLPALAATTGMIWASNEAMAAVIENSTESFVEYAASQGRNQEEAIRFAQTAVWAVESVATGAAIVGIAKLVQNKATIADKIKTLKANVSSIATRAFQRTQSSKVRVDTTSLTGILDAINKSPYQARAMEQMLKRGGSDVTSATMPSLSAKNVRLAGQRHPKTGIVFDQRGFPIFDDVAKCETRIAGDLGTMIPDAHKRAATRQLRADIETGKINKSIFSDAELLDIQNGKATVGTFTWHHHQDPGRMQLVPRKIQGILVAINYGGYNNEKFRKRKYLSR